MAAPTPSSNFQFLAPHDPLLLSLGAQAERYFSDDPVTCVMKLRQFGERLAQRAAASFNVSSAGLSQFALIHRLAALPHNLFPSEIQELFHQLRKQGNEAAHEFTARPDEVLHQLKMARQLAIWFHRTVHQPKDFDPGPFIPPPDPAQATREITAELERLRRALDTAQLDAGAARAAAEAEARQRLTAEERARLDAQERGLWQQLAEEAEKRLVGELAAIQARASAQPPEVLRQLAAASVQAAEKLELDEADTRHLIDAQLREAGWEADSERMTYGNGTRPEPGHSRAIAEWPTTSGRADYVLFVGLQAMAVVEAKHWRMDVAGVLPQARRYAETFTPSAETQRPGGPWGGSHLPFLFATNGRPYLKQLDTKSGIWFHDVRRASNHPRALDGWYTPQGLMDLLRQDVDAAEKRLREEPVDLPSLHLRDYQKEAIRAIEEALAEGRRTCLVAMATGTGKTRTCLGLVYRLVKANRFRRILFLVDRSALGTQTSDTFKTEFVDGTQTFATAYDLKDLGDITPEEATRLHISTVQGMVKRILSPSRGEAPPPISMYDCIVVDECHRGYTLDRELSEDELTFRDEADYISKYRRVLEHFDAVKIGLTATPALHTRRIFDDPVYHYGYRQAVVEGWLVDHGPPIRILTELSAGGIRWEAGEEVPTLLTDTQQLTLFHLPDELNFDVEDFNRRVVTENFNRVVAGVVAEHVDPRLDGKTLVFCVNDAHADTLVKVLKEALAARYGEVDDAAVMKITGSVDRVEEKIRRFKNERLPSIVVTVDLLTTGIDVPSICNLVFVRRVKSRILYEQMLGRATRLYTFMDNTAKESFRIFDAVDLYAALEPVSSMKPVVVQPQITFVQLVRELGEVPDGELRRGVLDQLLAKLHRKKTALRTRHADRFEAAAGGPVDDVLGRLKGASPREALEWFTAHPQVAELLDRVTGGSGAPRVYISEHPDALKSLDRGYGEGRERPEDYLEGFGRFVKENVNKVQALEVVTQRPRELTRETLQSLMLTLDAKGYTETQLRAAWRDVKNEDIAATIIGFVRQQALGEPLVPYAERVSGALKKVLASHAWTDPQRKWLQRIGQQLTANVVLDRRDFDTGAFKDNGGWSAIDKVLNGRLEQVLGELVEHVWSPAA